MSSVAKDAPDIHELEQSALGPSTGGELVRLVNLIDNGTNQAARRDAIAENHQYVREVEGVNYLQYYLTPTQENLELVLNFCAAQNLTSKGSEAEIIKIQEVLSGRDEAAKQRLIASIQQIRLFDARTKVTEGDNVSHHPITIDIKFKPEHDTDIERKEIKWRAVENGDEKMIAAIDGILADVDPAEVGKIARYFISYEWLPVEVIEAFEVAMQTAGLSADVKRAVMKVLQKHYAVKRDVRYDIVTNPNGKTAYMVSREVELEAGKGDGSEQLREELGWMFDMIRKSYLRGGYKPYVPSALDASKVALSQDPEATIREALEGSTDVDGLIKEMRDQVHAISRVFGFERHNQLVVTLPDKFTKVVPRLTTLAAVPRKHQSPDGFVPDLRTAVLAEIQALLAQR